MQQYTQLAQARENSTNAVSIYQSPAGKTVQAFLKITNTTTDEALVRVFHDTNGSTYDESTALIYDLSILPGYLLEIDHIFMDNSAGNLAYRTDTANALTATVYGIIR